jgi:Uma2 family endonuclease
MATVTEPLYTAEEYARLPDQGIPTELVKGKVVTMNLPAPRHGEICITLGILIGPYVLEHRLGRLVGNDSGIITEHNPDTVRGADVAFYSYSRVPPGPLPRGYLSALPELVFEVRSPTDRWVRVLRKVTEYLDAGVTAVCVLDEVSETVHVYRADELPQTLHGDDELRLPDILGDFAVAVQRFFA